MNKTEFLNTIDSFADICVQNGKIDTSLYEKYDVQRGLRDKNGNGVVSGLTKISTIEASKIVDGKKVPCEGRLFYRGYDIKELVKALQKMMVLDLKRFLIYCFSEIFRQKNN